MDLDGILELEQQYYEEGYEEGRRENLKHNLLEGKQYGLQVGFQRFHLLGMIYGICDILIGKIDDSSLQKNAKLIKQLIDNIHMDNSQENVAVYERSIFKIRNKFRLVLMCLQKTLLQGSTQERLTLENVETLSKKVAGEIQGYVEERDNALSHTEVMVQDQTTDW
ncbi:hypothetical protein KLU848_3094 [Kluyveromyces marxianus]|uniref:Uncharacterized ORAOV1 family protein YNL260C n=2 Tax=Kluyveromyces marxianus TaxID=4911 RepID=W0T2E8_KLUMD|nr:uncharacterized protein KLMA_10120 [Kluyveromyces marxianus DMKU3-1042]KAG0674664.1 hypothetical protein C6P41_002383 [Kluyveromyces marxianus]KAG0675986.1 hypothetical protein C6P43_004564 [Kluyveromyces marxianus]QGN14088.1 putative ORAOV1 family protein YNL260C [Kluyveromyces marxianus]BAO37742.1 uncharacterized ORAOV1 family protein YNL260C [Kluyveromyces marxianus DMKU3-1042]BAP69309.1 uncharacterized ORAOV1 family protein YNL260C [Kluyveromyces marxianus]